MRAHHDMGGVSALLCEPIDTTPHGLTAFDKRVDALRQLLGAQGLMSVDELRRSIEALPPADYDRLGYYERWICAIAAHLLRRGVFSEAALAGAIGMGAEGTIGDAGDGSAGTRPLQTE